MLSIIPNGNLMAAGCLPTISLQQKAHTMKIVREHTSRIDDSEKETLTMTVVCFDMEHLKDLPIVTDTSLGAPNIDTYKKLTSCTDEEFSAIMRPANEFLATLSDDEAVGFLRYYQDALFILATKPIGDCPALISNLTLKLQQELLLIEKIAHYVNNNLTIPIPELSYVGSLSEQESPGANFTEYEYKTLIVLCVISKLMVPIWGEYIHRIVSSELPREMKDVYCLEMIESLQHGSDHRAFLDTQWKLYDYVSNICRQTLESTPPPMPPYDFYHIVFSTLIVKRYVTVNPYTPDSNLIVWTWTCVRNAAQSLAQTLHRIHRRALDAQ